MFGNLLIAPDIDWEETRKELDKLLEGINDQEEGDVKPQLPNYFTDLRRFAKVLYEFWINTMNSDSIGSPQATWNELSQEEQDHFVESIQINISEPLKKYLDALETYYKTQPKSPTPTPPVTPRVIVPPYGGPPPVLNPTPTYPCYGCGRNPVIKPGTLCSKCSP